MIRPLLGIPMNLQCRPVCCSMSLSQLLEYSTELCHPSRRTFAGSSVPFLLPGPRRFLFSTTRPPGVGLECPCTRCFRPSHSIGELHGGMLRQKERQCAGLYFCRPAVAPHSAQPRFRHRCCF